MQICRRDTIYGSLNRVQSSRRLERECQRNLEVMWLTGRLAPDFKTIADFRRDNGKGIRGCLVRRALYNDSATQHPCGFAGRCSAATRMNA